MESALQLREAVLASAVDADVVVMAAAVADFRPVAPSRTKIKKTGDDPEAIHLTKNPDILAELGERRRAGVHVTHGDRGVRRRDGRRPGQRAGEDGPQGL